MSDIKPFLCDAIDKALLRAEWEKWFRSFKLYLASEEIVSSVKKKNKLLHLGGPQLQEVIYNIPGALVEYDSKADNDVFIVLVTKLDEYFSPKRNSTFERHLYRSLTPCEGEPFNKFLLRLRQQVAKCSFGSTKTEIEEICIKDKIIDSWAPLELKKRLLEKEQSLNEIVEACQIYEQINKQSQSLLARGDEEIVNKILSKKRFDQNPDAECFRCGRKGHTGNSMDCPARNAKCNKCSLIGHFALKCKTKNFKRRFEERNDGKQRYTRPTKVRCIQNEEEKASDDGEALREFDCFKIDDNCKSDEIIECRIGGQASLMVIDSGSRFNLVSEKDWTMLKNKNAALWNIRSNSSNQFKAYASDKVLKVICVFDAPIAVYNDSEIVATFYVIENGSQSLLGRETAVRLKVLRLGLDVNRIEDVMPFPKMKGVLVKLSIDHLVRPVQQPLRRIPIALEEKVANKLEEAIGLDIIEPVVGPSPWISPVVIVFKGNGEMRLCIDMRCANKAILRENYPLPTFDSFMTKLRRAKYFSRLDLKSAYHQLELHECSREITTFITHKGLFRYKRLMFGVNSAPEIFQRTMEGLLATCSNCLNYIDDVIIFGNTEEEHDKAVKEVLRVFKEHNLELNDDKCVWKTQKLKFLGHILSDTGFTADPEKIKVITEFRAPKSREETRSFLGLITYVGKFIPDLADLTEPLRVLLKADAKFVWGPDQANAFQILKTQLSRVPNLAYFDPNRRTRVVADASPVALGAVLIQFESNGEPKIISFASKSLSDVEKRYSQTEKESLALVWSVEKFYYYLAGLEFELVTDHKPLETIFKPTSKPPARIERWLLRLQSFKFKVIYRSGKDNIADSVSRLCKISNTSSFDGNCEENIFHMVANSVPIPLTITVIAKRSAEEEEISNNITHIKNESWESDKSNSYYPFRFELSAIGSILLRGTRIVIPKSLRSKILQLAHEGHPGESAMKRRLRAKVWWPLIDKEAENFVKNCRDCLLVSQVSRPAPMQRHAFPNGPWQCVATDLLGPLPNNEYVLVLIDYYSRYQEVVFLKNISSEKIIKAMEEIFCRLGLPKSLRTDNGRQYISAEFKEFCKLNDITQITTPPYWPQANGEVENMNRSLVKRLKIASVNKANYKQEIHKFILMYNVTPHSTTGSPPSELMFNRVIRDKIPSIQDITEDMIDSSARDLDCINKQKGKERGDKRRKAKESEIAVGDKVLLKNVVFPNKLTTNFDVTEYEVVNRSGNEVEIFGDGKTFRRNISHVKKIPSFTTSQTSTSPVMDSSQESPSTSINTSPPSLEEDSPAVLAKPGDPGLKLKLKKIGGMWQH